jgi:hypothetical protein
MPNYFGEFRSYDDLVFEFFGRGRQVDRHPADTGDSFPMPTQVVAAWYGPILSAPEPVEEACQRLASVVVFKQRNAWFESVVTHCCCEGLEGKWEAAKRPVAYFRDAQQWRDEWTYVKDVMKRAVVLAAIPMAEPVLAVPPLAVPPLTTSTRPSPLEDFEYDDDDYEAVLQAGQVG